MIRTFTVFGFIAAMVAACGAEPGQLSTPSPGKIQSRLSEQQRSALQKSNEEKVFEGADIGLWFKGAKVAEIINSINSIPSAARAVSIQVTNQTGKLADESSYYVELYDLPNNKAQGSISDVHAVWTSKGELEVDAVLKLVGTAKLHGHAKQFNTGGHIGVGMATDARLKGRLHFTPSADPANFFDANFQLIPTPISMKIQSGISDKKEVCWSADYPCAGTWRDPIRTCTARDCKILWQYDIPIGFTISETLKTDKLISLPLSIKIPDLIQLKQEFEGVKFDKSLRVKITPKRFTANEFGLALLAGVTVENLSRSSK